MEQNESELQRAIDSLTEGAGATVGVVEPAQETNVDNSVIAGDIVGQAQPMQSVQPVTEQVNGGDANLDTIKINALTELRPIIDRVDLPPESKFKICREIILTAGDKTAIEPAYTAARGIVDEKTKAEALLFVVEMIDKFGIA